MAPSRRKAFGAYFTPDEVAQTLVRWAVRQPTDRLLDPSCGDGRFLAAHAFSVGIEQDPESAAQAMLRAPSALVHTGDFFTWAAETDERFDCAAGNPPFIRYQTFAGATRKRAQGLCAKLGASFSGLASSWAPFLVATASLLKPGGRMAFVVPAEIGHAPYAAPALEYLVDRFSRVRVIAVRDKLFPELSEDCWLLHASGAGGRTLDIEFSAIDRFRCNQELPRHPVMVPVSEWRQAWKRRLRPYLLSTSAREAYLHFAQSAFSRRLGDLARIGIGYVSGANEFFHLRPSTAARFNIPQSVLHPAVRNGRSLPRDTLTSQSVEKWQKADEPIFLLHLPKATELPQEVKNYLETEEGQIARLTYKCRTREPWWSVPDVIVPDLMLTYMSGTRPHMVRNAAGCVCTNSLHAIRVKPGSNPTELARAFATPVAALSCELEGHPLGGGMLKLEVREAAEVIIPLPSGIGSVQAEVIADATATMRSWRHHAG